jgi:hypothetical protein
VVAPLCADLDGFSLRLEVIAAPDLLQSSQHGAAKRVGLAEPGIAALAQSPGV